MRKPAFVGGFAVLFESRGSGFEPISRPRGRWNATVVARPNAEDESWSTASVAGVESGIRRRHLSAVPTSESPADGDRLFFRQAC